MMNMNTGNPFGTVTSNVANTTNYATPNAEAYNAAIKPTQPSQQPDMQQQNAPQQPVDNLGAQQNNVNADSQAAQVMEDKWICKCGAENLGKFCTSCGMAKLEATKKTITCPKCNTENKEGSKFCGECGQKLV